MRPGRQVIDSSSLSQPRRSLATTAGIAGIGVVFVGALFLARSLSHQSFSRQAPEQKPAMEDHLADHPELAELHARMIQESLGSDDGFAFDIFYGGSIDGSLETCG